MFFRSALRSGHVFARRPPWYDVLSAAARRGGVARSALSPPSAPLLVRVTLDAVPAACVAAVEDALLGCGSSAVTLEDADAGTPAERSLFFAPGGGVEASWARTRVFALFAGAAEWEGARGAVERALSGAPLSFSVAPALDADWEAALRSSFQPVELDGRRGLWVVPSWAEAPPSARRVVRLEPGLAFGCGSHPTTRLCAAWLAGGGRCEAATALDYGCGSGLLAIASLRLGARIACAADADPMAVASTADNAELNGLSSRVDAVLVGPSINDAPPAWSSLAVPSGAAQFDVVVANILHGPLEELRPRLLSFCKPGARLALSGLLAVQADGLALLYGPHLDDVETVVDGEWALLSGTRNALPVSL